MTPDLLGRKLGSPDARERLEAARFLASHATKRQSKLIEGALAVETVAWVSRALERALQRTGPKVKVSAHPSERSELPAILAAQIHSDALAATAAQIIHEIEPILGTLRLSAEADIPDFEKSDTKRGLDRLEALVAGLSRLRRAATAPKISEFALDECIFGWTEETTAGGMVRVLRAGPQPCLVEGDKELVNLSFANGLRNAVDATTALSIEAEQFPDVTVNWGVTDIDAWISIVDCGIGFRGNLTRAFDIGTTTKAGHLGMGLTTAQQAMTSMEGSVRLIPAERGVRFEMRWPQSRG